MGEVDVLDRNACFWIFMGVDQARFSVRDRRVLSFHHQSLDLRDRRGCHRVCLDEIAEKRQKERPRPRQDGPELTVMNLIGNLQIVLKALDAMAEKASSVNKMTSDAQKSA